MIKKLFIQEIFINPILTILFTISSFLAITNCAAQTIINGPRYLTSFTTRALFQTTRIDVTDENPSNKQIGTGFFFEYKQHTLLIANQHVIKNASKGTLWLRQATFNRNNPQVVEGLEPYTITFDNFNTFWICHPKGFDICAMDITPILNESKKIMKTPFYLSLSEQEIPSDDYLRDVRAMETVVMVGFPDGMLDTANNFALLQKGSTASHPSLDFSKGPFGVIDIAATKGSSGSPIFLVLDGSFLPRGNVVHTQKEYYGLLGIFQGGRDTDVRSEMATDKISESPFILTKMPLHLGFYIKSSQLLSLGEFFFKKKP